MFLRHTPSGDLIRIDDLDSLCNPCVREVMGRDQAGEEEQDAARFAKETLEFPSGEPLPQCWRDAHYAARRRQVIY